VSCFLIHYADDMSAIVVDVGTIYEGTSNILLNTIAKQIRQEYSSWMCHSRHSLTCTSFHWKFCNCHYLPIWQNNSKNLMLISFFAENKWHRQHCYLKVLFCTKSNVSLRYHFTCVCCLHVLHIKLPASSYFDLEWPWKDNSQSQTLCRFLL